MHDNVIYITTISNGIIIHYKCFWTIVQSIMPYLLWAVLKSAKFQIISPIKKLSLRSWSNASKCLDSKVTWYSSDHIYSGDWNTEYKRRKLPHNSLFSNRFISIIYCVVFRSLFYLTIIFCTFCRLACFIDIAHLSDRPQEAELWRDVAKDNCQ